jgi:hypothetical protein
MGDVNAAVASEACLILRFVSLQRYGWVREGRVEEGDAPVEITRLDVTQSLGLTRAQDDDVGREEVVGLEADDITDADAPPRLVLELRPDEDFGETRVEITIGLMSFLGIQRVS